MALTVKARHPALGAEIRGVDMRQPLDSQTLQAINDAWTRYLPAARVCRQPVQTCQGIRRHR